MAVQFAFVIHRGMGCDDESATDEEQAEKILFYHPRLTSLNDQLNKINMIEGLIDFASKFSADPISTVVMQQYTWVFYECEKDVWLVIATDSQTHEDTGGFLSATHQPNTYAMEASLRNLYEMYVSMNGSIRDALVTSTVSAAGTENGATDLISVVKSLRKQIRKIHLRMRQELQDLQALVNRAKAVSSVGDDSEISEKVEHMGIRENTKTIKQVEAEIDTSNAEIAALTEKLTAALSEPSYTPVQLRRSLECFMLWHLHIGTLDSHTALDGIKGMRLLQPYYPDPVLHTINSLGALSGVVGVNASAALSSSVANGTGGAGGGTYGGTAGVTSFSPAGSIQSGIQSALGNAAFSTTVLRIRHAVEEATLNKSIGCVVLYEGRVAWSDLPAESTRVLSEYVLLQDAQTVRTQALSVMQTLDTRPMPSASTSSASSGNNSKKPSNPEAELEAAVQRSFNKLLTLRGFLAQGWEVLNLEEARASSVLLTNSNSSGGVGGAYPGVGAGNTGPVRVASESPAGEGASATLTEQAGNRTSTRVILQRSATAAVDDVTATHCEGPSRLYCPRLYAYSAGVRSATGSCGSGGSGGEGRAEVMGRALFFRHNRATVVILLPDWASDRNSFIASSQTAAADAAASTSGDASQVAGIAFPADATTPDAPSIAAASSAPQVSADASAGFHFMTSSVSNLLSELRQGNRKLTSLRCPDFLEYVVRYDPNQACSAQSAEFKSELSLSSLGSGRTADGTSADGANGAKASASPAPVDAGYESWLLNHACLLTMCVRLQQIVSPECARLEKALRGVVYADETGSALAGEAGNVGTTGAGGTSVSGGGAGQGGVAGGASPAASASTNAAYERLASGIAIAEELQLGAVRQELPVSPALRNVRFIYFNPVDGSLRVCGINNSDLSPLLCSPRAFRELLVSNLLIGSNRASSTFVSLTQSASARSSVNTGSNSSAAAGSASRLKRVTAAVVDRLTDKQGFKFPAGSALLAECLEPAVVRALNDIWVELAGKELVGEHVAQGVQEACLRVSTPQRGGMWVTGRRVGQRYLYMIIDKCVTMNDMYLAFQHLADFLQK